MSSPLTISISRFLAATGITTSPGTFLLNVSLSNGVNTVTWSFPPGMLDAIKAPTFSFTYLTLQRSTTDSHLPSTLVAYATPNNPNPLADPKWTTIRQWTQAQYVTAGYTASISDPWAVPSPVCYRLLADFLAPAGENKPPIASELAWNTALVVPPQILNCATDPNASTRLWWTPPDVSWFP